MKTDLHISDGLTSTKHTRRLVCVLCVLGFITSVDTVTTSLVLQQSPTVIIGQTATYVCAATGTGTDPVFIWTIRNLSGTVIQNLTSQATTLSDTNPNDGSARSQLQFTLTSTQEGNRIWCGARDAGASSPSIEIFASLNQTSTAAGIGENCTLNGNIPCGSFAFCQSSTLTCQCSSGYYNNAGNCVVQSQLGNSCSTTASDSCIATNSFCNTSALCACISGYVRSGLVCIQSNSAGLGNSCINPVRTCVISNSVCSSGICQCNTSYYQSGSQSCSLTSTVGQTCNSAVNASCSTNRSYCSSITNQCICQAGYVYTSTSNSCDIPVLGQACITSVGCRSVAGLTVPSCTNNICQCPSSYYAYNGECYAQGGVGSTCFTQVLTSCSDSNSRCVGNGVQGTCTCNDGYSNNGNGGCVFVTGSDNCPANTQTYNITNGDQNSPNVRVNRTCYEVQLQGTVVLHCQDSKNAKALKATNWIKLITNVTIVASTGRYINGDFLTPSLTISNANASDSTLFICELCYSTSGNCTRSVPIEVIVNGTAISSVSISVSSTTPIAGTSVTFSCTTVPAGVASSYEWLRNGVSVGNTSTIVLSSIQSSDSGAYVCIAANDFSTVQSSNQPVIDVLYAPTFSLPGGGNTVSVFGNFNNGPITITCSLDANPAVTEYRFFDSLNRLLAVSTTNTFQVTSTTLGYGTYSCTGTNSVGTSNPLFFNVQLQQSAPSTGASTEDDGVSTGTIAAIVIGIIFFILLIIIIIICCCNYGWCRKKEKTQIEPVIVEQPKVKPYIPRSVVSATSSTVSRQDVGVVVNGHANVTSEEPVYVSPRYYLRPAKDAGPIISMFDNNRSEPRAHQLPALDTQYLYTDEEPKRRHKKRRRKKHRRSYREEERPVEESPPPPVNDDEDLIVVPGRQNENYFE